MAGINKEIAVRANVSPSTVSIVLNGKSREFRISTETANKVLEVAKELGFEVPEKIQLDHLSRNCPSITLLVANRLSTINKSTFFSGLQQAQYEFNEEIEVSMQPYINGKLSRCQLLKGGTTDGIIISGLNDTDYQYLIDNPPPIPVVLYNHESDVFPYVIADNIGCDQEIVSEMSNQGVKSIMLITPFVGSFGFNEHIKGVYNACYEKEIRDLTIVYVEYSREGGVDAANKIMLNNPDAVFFNSLVIANGAVEEFKRRDYEYLDHHKIVSIGFYGVIDDSRLDLTTVNIPSEEMITAGVDTLIRMIRKKSYTHGQVFPLDFTYRKSFQKK